MAKRTVIWTETASKQRRLILKYWTKRNGTTTYAEKLIILIKHQTKYIVDNPKIFKRADFPETYVSAMGHFSIYYKIYPNQIIITAFWDNRQDPKSLLKALNDR